MLRPEHEITASFYVDNQVATQNQNGETTSYTYDPAGRPEKTVSEGTTKATVINHYPGPGEAVSWTCEENAKECEEGKAAKWTRNIAGIDGTLAATQHDSESAVLQVHDLEGNVIATAADSETETKLLTTYNPTEFGVPVNGTPPTKYSWLGASGYATEQASGQANPGGSTYVSQLGRPLQTQPIESPGAYANGSYNGAVFSPSPSAEALAQSDSYGAGAPVREAERQKAQQEETEKHTYENECHIASCEQHNGPGEGNCEANCEVGGEEEPEIDDPSILLTSRQSFFLAAGLRNGGAALEAATARIPAAALFIKLVVALGGHIATELAEGLEGCYKLINELNANARCKPFIDLLVVVPTEWGVDTCFAQQHRSRKGKVSYSYPYCDKVGDE